MQLLYLHGAPAVGKLTVATHLVKRTNARLFDNHIAIDFARAILDFEDNGFWELVKQSRLLILETAASHGVPLVIMTSCYSDLEDRETLIAYEDILDRFGAKILPVFLHCSENEMQRRVGSEDRKIRRKISNSADLKQFMKDTICTPIPRDNCLHLSTEDMPARAVAEEIVRHFQL